METNIQVFKQKLNDIDISSVSNDLLVTNYLKNIFEQQDYYLKIYSWVLNNVLNKSTPKVENISMLDFGCGNGLFAIFAKYCGVGKVYGCDFNANFVEAASVLANKMNIEVDGWFVCNEDELYKKCNTLKLDIVAGTDVIEHIYNLNTFFKNIHLLNHQMLTAFTTASVYENYFKRKALYKLMHQDEYVGSNILEATSKDEFAGMPYLEIRKKLIANNFEELNTEQTNLLAKATKGLRKDDIITAVNRYLKNGILPLPQSNKHNTCDPITGNFTERMLLLKEYKKLYSEFKFELNIYSGFYAADGNKLKAFLQTILNKFITINHNTVISRIFAPLILLVGTPHKKIL
ncbi:MAG: class I SAM-dependent methyltransferase [Chitinophagaceae bacterium]